MDKKKSSFPMPSVGAASLLVIFAVLCLLTFALLSLGTALADRRLSEGSLEAVRSYYAADTAAEEIFAALRRGEVPEGVTRSGDTYTYSIAISEKQVLAVEVTGNNGAWRVDRWQAVAAEETDTDDTLTLWDGETAQENDT